MGKLTKMDDELGYPHGLETSILIHIVSTKFPPKNDSLLIAHIFGRHLAGPYLAKDLGPDI